MTRLPFIFILEVSEPLDRELPDTLLLPLREPVVVEGRDRLRVLEGTAEDRRGYDFYDRDAGPVKRKVVDLLELTR